MYKRQGELSRWIEVSKGIIGALRFKCGFATDRKTPGDGSGKGNGIPISRTGWVAIADMMEKPMRGYRFKDVGDFLSTALNRGPKDKARLQVAGQVPQSYVYVAKGPRPRIMEYTLVRAIVGHAQPGIELSDNSQPFTAKNIHLPAGFFHRTTKGGLMAIFMDGYLRPGVDVGPDGEGRVDLQLAVFLSVDAKRCQAAGRKGDEYGYEMIFDAREVVELLGDRIRVLANGVVRTTYSIPIRLCKRVLRIKGTGKERVIQCLFDRDWMGAAISGHSGGVLSLIHI